MLVYSIIRGWFTIDIYKPPTPNNHHPTPNNHHPTPNNHHPTPITHHPNL